MDVLILSLSLLVMIGVSIGLNYKFTKNNKTLLEEKEFFLSIINRPDNAVIIFSKNREAVFISQSARKKFKTLIKNPKTILSFDSETNHLPPPYENIIVKKHANFYHNTEYTIFTLKNNNEIDSDTKELPEQSHENNEKAYAHGESSPTTFQVVTSDPLTGLPNEFEAIAKINDLILARKELQTPFGVFVFGIDHFKEISITLGYSLTNRLIKEIAEFLKSNTSEMLLYRLDCEKFLLIAPECFASMSDLHIFARDFLTSINNKNIGNQEIHLSGSLGICKYPNDGNHPAKLLENASSALYRAQHNNESNFEFYQRGDNTSHLNEIKINDDILRGLQNNEFVLHYQPIFDIMNGEYIGVEVLLRWDHPKHGLISPDKFLYIAEKTGLVIEIGEYVFKEAAKQKKVWNSMGLKQLIFTINLSVREMQIASLILKLEKYLIEYNLLPDEFNLDITEEAAMLHYKETQRDIKLFNESGISLTLDRFGSGLFSISHLQNLPLDKLKLDRSLTADLESNGEHKKTVKSIVALAHSLGIEVAAEGVESKEMIDALIEIGCRYAQGYYYSKPLNAEDFIIFYQDQEHKNQYIEI